MKCSYCENEAIYKRRYSGENLCIKHFIRTIEEKVYRVINPILEHGDKIGLAVSGGKDSLSMAFIVNKIVGKIRGRSIDLVALIVDEGIAGYRDKSVEAAVRHLKEWGIEYRVGYVSKIFETTVDKLVAENDKNLSCTYCGLLRRRVLNFLAEDEGVDKIFTGHNASDIAQTILLNMLQGNVKNIMYETEAPGAIPRIYPLKKVLEPEVTLYAYLTGIEYYDKPCPYTRYSIRNDIRNFLTFMENKRPGITFSLIASAEKIKASIGKKLRLKRCKLCGQPTTREVCKVCELSMQLGLPTPKTISKNIKTS